MQKIENSVMFNTPGTSPMYEMLLFIYHWGEDFSSKTMKESFIKKAQILLLRESSAIYSAFEAGMRASSPNPGYYKNIFKHNRMTHNELEEEQYHNDKSFAKLNPEE
jgi:hypothetical protein